MFARTLASPGLRAFSRAPLARAPRRNMSASAKKVDEVRRGFDEIVPFLKRELQNYQS